MNGCTPTVPWHTSRVAVQHEKSPAHKHILRRVRNSEAKAPQLHPLRRMQAQFQGELLASDRPTIPMPAPRESGVRLKVERVAYAAAIVDVVVCDLSRDPRSEDYAPSAGAAEAGAAEVGVAEVGVGGDGATDDEPPATCRSGFSPARARARFGAFAVVVRRAANDGICQNDSPPSTSIVRALK